MASPRTSNVAATGAPSRTRSFTLLATTTWCLHVGLGIYFSITSNFMVERLGIEAHQLGIMESIREIPGLCTAFMAAAVMHLAEKTLGGGALLFLALGIWGLAQTDTLAMLIVCQFVASIGFHLWMPVASGLGLAVGESGQKARTLGRLSAVGAAGLLAGMVLVYLAAEPLGYRTMYLVAGGAIVAAALAVRLIDRGVGHATGARLVFRRRYRLYYALMFLEGCRRQIFMTFAVFALVKTYGASVSHIAGLMIINGALNFLAAPRIGRWIDRIGERRVLMASYAALAAIFFGYATARSLSALSVLYVLDNAMFAFMIAITTYVEKIAGGADLRPTLATGSTMNHVAAVTVPLVGGLAWQALGYQVVFLGGALIALVSVAVAARMKTADVAPP